MDLRELNLEAYANRFKGYTELRAQRNQQKMQHYETQVREYQERKAAEARAAAQEQQ